MEDTKQAVAQSTQSPANNGVIGFTPPAVATPSPIVPPGTAIPQIPGARSEERGARKEVDQKPTSLPKKVVTLESVQEVEGQKAEGRRQKEIGSADMSSALEESKSAISNQQLAILQPATSNQQQVTVTDTDTDTDTDTATDTDSVELPDLPIEFIEFLSSERYKQSSELLKQQFALSDDDLSFLGEMDHATFGKVIDLSQYVEALLGEFPNLNEQEKKKVIGILLAYRYQPFTSIFTPRPEEAAHAIGIQLPAAPYYRIYDKPLTYRGAANEIAHAAGIELMGQTQERLRDLLISKLKGIRTDGQVEEQLMRTAELGGLGLTEERARITREAMTDVLSRADIVTEEEFSRQLNREIRERRIAQTASQPNIPSSPLAEDEEKEIKSIAARMPKPERETSPVLDAAVHAVMNKLSWKPDDTYIRRRLENGISTRLRGVHSRNELFMKLMREDKVGGLGLDRANADRLIAEIEAACDEFRDQVLDEEKKKLLMEEDAQRKKVAERKKREAEEHARWYEEKIKAKQTGITEGTNPLERLKAMAKQAGFSVKETPHPIDEKEQVRERKQFGELVATNPNAAAVSAFELLKTVVQKQKAAAENDQTKKGAQPESIPERKSSPPPVVKVSPETIRMKEATPPTLRPKVEDVAPARAQTFVPPPMARPFTNTDVTVRPSTSSSAATAGASSIERTARSSASAEAAKHLTGPVQELGNMTLEHFRRLSAKPADAANSVRAMVTLLKEESYQKGVAAVQAWRSSPLQKQYLELISKAFGSKKSVTALADELRAKGEAAPTADEITAIVGLNAELKL